MPLRTPALALVLTALLFGCASNGPTAPRETASASGEVEIAFTNHRMGELEPCGCSTHPEGGLSREWEFYKREGFKGIATSAGITFVPLPENFNASNNAHYLRKANYLVDGMNQLGVAALGVSIEDALLGVDNLKTLSKKAKFPFLSANLVDKKTGERLFPAYHEIKQGSAVLTFIGLSGGPYYGYPAPAGIEAKEPAAALNEVLAKLPQDSLQNRVFIVLTSLSKREQRRLREEVGRMHFYFGGDLVEPDPGFFQDAPTVVWTNPSNRGRSVALLKLELKTPVNYLRSPTIAGGYEARVESAYEEIKGLQTKLKSKKLAKKARKTAETRLAELEGGLSKLEILSRPESPYSTRYEGKFVVLGDAYAPKAADPFAPLLDGYHESVRRSALNETQAAVH